MGVGLNVEGGVVRAEESNEEANGGNCNCMTIKNKSIIESKK